MEIAATRSRNSRNRRRGHRQPISELEQIEEIRPIQLPREIEVDVKSNEIIPVVFLIKDEIIKKINLPFNDILRYSINNYNNNSELFNSIIPLVDNLNEIIIIGRPLIWYILSRPSQFTVLKMFEQLSRYNIDFNIKDEHIDNSFLHGIIDRPRETRTELFKIALLGGADPYYKDKYGRTAYCTIKKRRLIHLLELIYECKPKNLAINTRMHNLVLESDNKCPICREDMIINESMITKCLHAYHTACIQNISKCPVCREPI